MYEPTSVAKCGRLIEAYKASPVALPSIDIATPNIHELRQMASLLRRPAVDTLPALDSLRMPISDKSALMVDAVALMDIVDTLFVKLGRHGVLAVWRSANGLQLSHSPAPDVKPAAQINTTGAGDTFTGAVLVLARKDAVAIAARAQRAAVATLHSTEAVSPNISAIDVE